MSNEEGPLEARRVEEGSVLVDDTDPSIRLLERMLARDDFYRYRGQFVFRFADGGVARMPTLSGGLK